MAMGLYAIVGPLLRCLLPERAHRLTIAALKAGLAGGSGSLQRPRLAVSCFGRSFPNPLGLAAGFDKDAEVADAMLRLGFGFVEVGSITPLAQPGNPRPRLFRLTEDRAVINRMGFNNHGAEAALRRLAGRERRGTVGVNLGKNKTSEDAVADYVTGVRRLGPVADYLVVNVSSPNTPGLRALQDKGALEALLRAVLEARDEIGGPPLLLKIAPDLTDADKEDIASVALEVSVDGLICTNTTIARPEGLRSPHAAEVGGLSGRPVFASSTAVLGDMYRLTGGQVPIIGVGGIEDAETAYAKIRAGATLLQLYSALVFEGPPLIRRVVDGLEALLDRDGFAVLADAVGADHR